MRKHYAYRAPDDSWLRYRLHVTALGASPNITVDTIQTLGLNWNSSISYPSFEFEFDFGDGTTLSINENTTHDSVYIARSRIAVSHKYAAEGDYTVSVRNLSDPTLIPAGVFPPNTNSGTPTSYGYVTEYLAPFPLYVPDYYASASVFEYGGPMDTQYHVSRLTRQMYHNSIIYAIAHKTNYANDPSKPRTRIQSMGNASKATTALEIDPELFIDLAGTGPCDLAYSLRNIPIYSIPHNLFDPIEDSPITDLSGMFDFTLNGVPAYSQFTGPVPELWNTHPNVIHRYCFAGLTMASNYADIPADWK